MSHPDDRNGPSRRRTPDTARERAPGLRAHGPGLAQAVAADVQRQLAYDRTHLANERTFAAWLRTGLSIAAGGIAVAHVVPEPARDSWVALLLGATFVVLGIAVIGHGAREFTRVSAELQRESGRQSPAPGRSVYALTTLVGVLLLAVLLFLWSHRGMVRADAARSAPATPASGPAARSAP